MQCPRYQAKNPDNLRFCEECGVRLALACSNCGSEISPGNPDHAHAQDSLGDVYYHRDQFDDALSEYKEAVRLDPFHSRALQLAATHENAGRYRAAIARWSSLTARRRS
jgi:cytochrome c-type biogenesis protein CcmH/NrfG